MKTNKFSPVIIESAPAHLKPGVLYISIKYHTALHLCACGCGEEVVTPIAPDQWQLMWDGKTVSLSPSIGNYRLPCHSHYYIRNNMVVWIPDSKPRKKRKSKWRKMFHAIFNV